MKQIARVAAFLGSLAALVVLVMLKGPQVGTALVACPAVALIGATGQQRDIGDHWSIASPARNPGRGMSITPGPR